MENYQIDNLDRGILDALMANARIGIGIDFSYDFLDFFQFQVNDVIHNALGQCHMLFE